LASDTVKQSGSDGDSRRGLTKGVKWRGEAEYRMLPREETKSGGGGVIFLNRTSVIAPAQAVFTVGCRTGGL